jgi:STE24 endopeptidase
VPSPLARTCLFGLLVLSPVGAARALDLSPAAVASRTPAAEQWQMDEVPLERYFSDEELGRWKEHRGRHRLVNLVALGLDLLTYLLLLSALGRRLEAGTGRLAARLAKTRAARRSLSRRIGNLLSRAFGEDWAAAMLFAYAYFAIGVLVELPTSLWHEQISQQAGLSAYTAGSWSVDLLKGLLLGCLFFTLLVFGLYGLIRRFPRAWWALLAIPVVLAYFGYALLSPYQTRVFHEVRTLEQHPYAERAELTKRLRQLSRSQGITLGQIKVVRASRVSRSFNAYLAGVGPTRELVLYDTLLEAATVDEIAAIVAHELGHLADESPLRTHALPALGLVGLLGVLALVLRHGSRLLGLAGPGAIRTLPLLGLTVALVLNLTLPLQNHRSRQRELRADRFALTLTGDPEAYISLQVKVARRNKADLRPSRWAELWLFSHPPVAERIGLALWYQRWLHRRP